MRLDRYLAQSGERTRSEAARLLRSGAVRVNGEPVRDGGFHLKPDDRVELMGQAVEEKRYQYLMLHKPAGLLTAARDSRAPTVMQLLPESCARRKVLPVGRLDKDTTGLLLFTNDGELAHRLISPRYRVPKVYYARHEGQGTEGDVEAFAGGLVLGDGTVCLPAKLEPLGPGESLVTICEGKYHQVRRMLASRGMPVTYLERRAEGQLTLDGVPRGHFRVLSQAERHLLSSGGETLSFGHFL